MDSGPAPKWAHSGMTSAVNPQAAELPWPRIENGAGNLALRIPGEGEPRVIAAVGVELVERFRHQRHRLAGFEIENRPRSRSRRDELAALVPGLQLHPCKVDRHALQRDFHRSIAGAYN